jgi:hypothetical protein
MTGIFASKAAGQVTGEHCGGGWVNYKILMQENFDTGGRITKTGFRVGELQNCLQKTRSALAEQGLDRSKRG